MLSHRLYPVRAEKASKMRIERFFRAELILAVALAAALTPLAAVVQYLFAPMCASAALVLLLNRPKEYISFTYWTWMLTPLVRRIADYHTAFHQTSLIMTAPLLVTSISVIGLFIRTPVRTKGAATPYFVIIGVVFYGFFVGLPDAGLAAATFDLLNWALPAVFALYVLRSPLPAEQIAASLFRALIWGGLLLGTYGAYQYFLLPPWDAQWMLASNLTSIGTAVRRGVRVFGPLNSPGPYAVYMSASILVAMDSRSRLKWFAATPAAIGLLLSLVRAAWGGLVVGILAVIARSATRKRARYLIILTVALALITPIIAFTPIGEALWQRFETLQNLDNDNSFLARQRLYNDFTSQPIAHIAGVGLAHSGIAGKQGDDAADAAAIDSGLIEAFFVFGGAGMIMFGALALIAIRSLPNKRSPSSVTAWSVAVTALSCIIFGNTLVGSQGMLVLPLLALATRCGMAAREKPRRLKTNISQHRVAAV